MKNDRKKFLKGVFCGFFGTVLCMMLLGTRKPDMDVKTGVDVNTGESVLLLNARRSQDLPVPPVTGRYQISSWGCTQRNGGGYGAFLTDTATGRTKIVYSQVTVGNGKDVRINNLDIPFDKITP